MEKESFYPSKKQALRSVLTALFIMLIVYGGMKRIASERMLGVHGLQNEIFYVIEVFCAVIAILLFLHGLRDLVRPRPYITLSPAGITHKGFWYKTVPWKYVKDVYVESRTVEFPTFWKKPSQFTSVFVEVTDKEAFFKEVPARPKTSPLDLLQWKKNESVHAALGKKFELFGAGMLTIPPEELKQRIVAYRAENHV